MKKAFLVGINKYANGQNLNGCVNDTLLMYKLLSEKFGFLTKDIDIITDEKCTKKNIIEGLKRLTLNTSENDTIYFHYSGHGSQIVSNDWTKGNEVDGRDEILCPHDMDWNNPLRDNDLNKIFSTLTCKSVVVLDSCFSGTGLRNDKFLPFVIKNRFLSPPIDNMLSNPLIELDEELRYVFPTPISNNTQTQLNRVFTTLQGNAILISGCKDNQTSADAMIGNRYHGALTYSLCQALSISSYKITYKDLIASINTIIKKGLFTQTPQLESREELQNTLFLS